MSISEDIKELIQEGYFISDETISVDLHKFESGECNKLIISGLSGAGKTTLGKQLAKKYNCSVIDLDDIWNEIIKNNPINKVARSKRKSLFFEKLSNLLTNNVKYIIGGVKIIDIYYDDPNINKLLLTLPFIFLGKSALKASWDAAIRDHKKSNKKVNILIRIHTKAKFNFIEFYKYEKKLKMARCAVKGSVIQQLKI